MQGIGAFKSAKASHENDRTISCKRREVGPAARWMANLALECGVGSNAFWRACKKRFRNAVSGVPFLTPDVRLGLQPNAMTNVEKIKIYS